MTNKELVALLAGKFSGPGRLNLTWPGEPINIIEYKTTLTATAGGGGEFVKIDYTWEYEGEQGGSMLVSIGDGKVTMAWGDSFHQQPHLMICEGKTTEHGFVVHGSYPAGEGPDWGWRTELKKVSPTELHLLMTNIHPDGQEDWAVEHIYTPEA